MPAQISGVFFLILIMMLVWILMSIKNLLDILTCSVFSERVFPQLFLVAKVFKQISFEKNFHI